MKKLSPLKAVRKKCLDCCCNQSKEVLLCPSDDCILYPYRFGKNIKNMSNLTLKVIRKKCIDCSDGFKDIRECPILDCYLYPFRMGKNPNISKNQ